MYKFFIPFYYMFHTRYKTSFDKVSWLIIYFIPVSTLGYYYTQLGPIQFILIHLINITLLFNIYELGYIQNDVQTIKNETNPTLRLNKKEGLFFNKYYNFIVIHKLFISLGLLILLSYINLYYKLELNIINLLIAIVLLRVVFFVHNMIRNRFNILTFFGLLSLKYLIAIVYIIPINNIEYFLSILFIFPVLRTLEHATKLKYNVLWLQGIVKNHDEFRVKYYLLLSLILLYFHMDYTNIYFLLAVYFLIYRGLLLLILKNNIYTRNK